MKYNDDIYFKEYDRISKEFTDKWDLKYPQETELSKYKNQNKELILKILDSVYNKGVIQICKEIENKEDDYAVVFIKNRIAQERELKSFFTIKKADQFIYETLNKYKDSKTIDCKFVLSFIETNLNHNVIYDSATTNSEKLELLENISPSIGMIQSGEKVVSKGELITKEKYQILLSFKKEYMAQLG